MMSFHEFKNLIIEKRKSVRGYSLIELMIVIALIGIIMAAVVTSQGTQTESFSTQQSVAKIQQDLRGAIYMMQYDLMNAGRDPYQSMDYGISDIKYYEPNAINNSLWPPGDITDDRPIDFPGQQLFNSFPVLEFSSLRWDSDGDGISDKRMTIRYQVFDFNNDGRLDLGRRIGIDGGALGTPDLVAEGVIAIGYVFAYDDSPDGDYKLARTPPPPPPPDLMGSVIWAVDTNGNGLPDFNADTDRDGQITAIDDINNDGTIGSGDGAMLAPEVELKYIRAVKISVLLQSERQSEENWVDLNQYVVGNRVIPSTIQMNNNKPFGDRYRRRLKTITVALRNFQKA